MGKNKHQQVISLVWLYCAWNHNILLFSAVFDKTGSVDMAFGILYINVRLPTGRSIVLEVYLPQYYKEHLKDLSLTWKFNWNSGFKARSCRYTINYVVAILQHNFIPDKLISKLDSIYCCQHSTYSVFY